VELWRDYPTLGPEEKKEMGRNLRKLRKQNGWTQDRLALEVHKEPSIISKHESGQQAFGIEGMVQYSMALGCRMEDLLPRSIREQLSYDKNPVLALFNDLDSAAQDQVLSLMRFLGKRAS